MVVRRDIVGSQEEFKVGIGPGRPEGLAKACDRGRPRVLRRPLGSRTWQLPHLGRMVTKAVASYVDMTTGGGYLCRRALAEEVAQGGGDQGRGFLGEEVAGGQGLAADVDGVFLPDAERVVAAADETLAAP